jgi:hypothetical protein
MMDTQTRFWAYQTITFATQAAAASRIARALERGHLEMDTIEAIERTHREAYYSADLAWNALKPHADTMYCASEASQAEQAAISALQAAINRALDADPQIVDEVEMAYQSLLQTDETLRALHEAQYVFYVEEGGEDESEIPVPARLPDEEGLKRLYQGSAAKFPGTFTELS